jgi:hypothetical protein
MKLKHANGWFAAGPEVERALTLLSDGAFRLFMYLCLQASRETGRLSFNDRNLTVVLQKSRRSIITYLDELERHGICQIQSAPNQHRCGCIEICDAFWPYRVVTLFKDISAGPRAVRDLGH